MSSTRITNYPHRMGGHCGSGALRDLLEWAGLGWDGPPDEGLVFGLGGGLSFMYIRASGLTPPIYLVGRNGDMELDFCRRLGIETERIQTDDADEGWRWVTREIDAGRPVMIWADIAELPYLRVRLSNTRHDIVVIGYDEARALAWVVDNDREQVQEVPLQALARARASHGFPDPNRHATYPMRFPGRLPELLPVARDAAASAARNMRGSEATLFDPAALPADSVVAAGLKGVEVFTEDLATWRDNLTGEQLETALGALPVFIDKAGTGGGLFRRLEAQFCAGVARRTDDRAFARAADVLLDCANAWSRLAACAAAEQLDWGAVVAHAEQLPSFEQRAVQALEEAASP
jgi:hypothetical protein